MKKIISIVSIIVIITVLSFALPSQTYAVWWNPFSWSSENKQAEEQEQPPTTDQNTEETEKQNTIAPFNNIPSSDAETIEALKIEVATLKTSLDNLYKAHNSLVEDHNVLLKYVNATVSPSKSVSVITDNSSLEKKVTDLENKLYNVCRRTFSSLGGLGRDNCPSSGLLGTEALESRIKKLEGGY
ncbi:MAG: hypothetical protein WC908_00590 [Candidatus Paceibacterota bacterium]